jgi:hypothetical protein
MGNDTMLMEPVGGPSVWTRADFEGRDDWIWRFSDSELADLDAALRGVQARGLGCAEFGIEDFPLPVTGARLAALRKELIDGRGFVLLRKLPVEDYSLPELEAIYWGMGCHLGTVISQNGKGDVLTHVTMHADVDPKDPNLRGYQDRRHQEPHNDLADVVGLLCVRKAKSGGASSVVNSASMYNDLLSNHPEYLPVLYRGFHMDTKGEGGNEKGVTAERVRVLSWYRERLFLWFAKRRLDSAFPKMGVEPTPLERAALDYLGQLTEKPEYRIDMQLEDGDIQFVNNYRVMHARTAFEDHDDPARWRLMLRLWVNLPELELEPDFSKLIRLGVPGRRAKASTSAAT